MARHVFKLSRNGPRAWGWCASEGGARLVSRATLTARVLGLPNDSVGRRCCGCGSVCERFGWRRGCVALWRHSRCVPAGGGSRSCSTSSTGLDEDAVDATGAAVAATSGMRGYTLFAICLTSNGFSGDGRIGGQESSSLSTERTTAGGVGRRGTAKVARMDS